MAAAGILAAACTQDDVLVNNADEVVINPGIQQAALVQSRATTPLATLNPDAELVLGYGAYKATYVYDATATKWVADGTPIYWDNLAANNGAGGFQFTAMAPADYSNGGTVADQSDNKKYLAADLLAATYTAAARKEVLDIELGHKMAQVVVNVASADTDFDLAGASLVIKGAKPGYDGTAAVTGDAADIEPLRTSTTGASFMAVLPVQTLAAGALKLEFVIDVPDQKGNTYTWTNTDKLTLTAGASLAIDLNLSKTGITPGDIKVTDWENTNPVSGEVQMVINGTPGSVTGDAPTFTNFQLWKNDDEANAITYTYNATDSKWETSDKPFFLEDLVTGDVFHARHTPATADAVTGKKDILEAHNVTVQGGCAALLFTHVKSKLTVVLQAGTDFNADIDLETAKVTPTDYSDAATGESTSFILPGDLTIDAGDLVASILVNDFNYEVKLPSDLTLAEGEHTTLTVTMLPTGVTVAVAVKPWDDKDASADGAVTIVPNDLAALNGTNGEFLLECGTLSATYTWTNNTLALKTGSSHIYWENIPETNPASYLFKLTFTPTASDAVTTQKDVHYAEATITDRGGQPSFTLAHTNAKLTISLTGDGDFPTTIDLTKAVVTPAGYNKAATGQSTSFILPPTTTDIAAGTTIATITVGGLTYNAKSTADLALNAGEHTTLTVTLTRTTATMAISVTAWTTGTASAGGAVTIDANSLTALNGTDGELKLECGALSAIYTWANNGLTLKNGSSHIYWESITGTGPYTFKLTFTPAADAVTGISDVHYGEASVARGERASFTLEHIKAKLTISLAKSADFPTGAAITGASIKLQNFNAVQLTGSATSKEFIVEPQNLTINNEIATITLGGLTYIAKLNAATTLTAGKNTTLTVALSPTQTTMTVAVTDWTGATAGATGAVAITANSMSALPGPGTVKLEYKPTSSSHTSYTATYDWKIPTGGSAYTLTLQNDNSDIYWENITAAEKYPFTLTYTPDAADAVTGKKDILKKTIEPTDRGAQLAFTGDNSLDHINAKLTVVLANKTGLTVPVLTNAKFKLLTYSNEINRDATNSNSFIFEPGSITASSTAPVVSVIIGSKTYNAYLANDLTLTAGVQTVLTITLTPTAATMTVTVAEWGTPVNVSASAAVEIAASSITEDLKGIPGQFVLTYGSDANVQTATYNWAKKTDSDTDYELTLSGNPIYWENIPTTDPKNFTLTFTPTAADAVTGVKDVLSKTLTTYTHGSALAFELAHTMAKLTVHLANKTNYTVPNLIGAKFKLLTYTDEIDHDATNGNSFLIDPTYTPIATTTRIVKVITTDGKEYDAYPTSELTLAAGTHTSLTIIVEPTKVTMTVTDGGWDEVITPVTANTKVELTNGTVTGLAAGKFVLTYGAPVEYTATYNWDGSSALDLDNTTDNDHIYWENISETDLKPFTLTFTPTAAEATGVYDVCSKTLTTYTHSSALEFELAHVNSKITVKLAKGTTYSTGEWDAIVAANTTDVIFTGLTNSAYTGDYDFTKTALSAIFEPQAIGTTGKTITVEIPTATDVVANTLTVNLYNHVKVLQAGKEYIISITVDKTKVTVGNIDVSVWEDIEGTGTIDY